MGRNNMSSENKVMCNKAKFCGKNDRSCPHNRPHEHNRHCDSRCSLMGDTHCSEKFVVEGHSKSKMNSIWEN